MLRCKDRQAAATQHTVIRLVFNTLETEKLFHAIREERVSAYRRGHMRACVKKKRL